MPKPRKHYSADEKAKIALDALSGRHTQSQLTAKYGVHSTQITSWKKQLKSNVSDLFNDKRKRDERDKDELYKKIGQLNIELDWLKKNLRYSTTQKRKLIESGHTSISIHRQCDLVGLSRASYYYRPAKMDPLTLTLLRVIDEEYTRHPFLGSRKMTKYLAAQGYSVNRKRVQRLYQLLGIEAIYCKPNTSKAHPDHKIYPYLLRNLPIVAPDQVYCTDITYIRMQRGFVYLVAVMDWFSRYVLGWSLSPSLDADFCVELLEDVLSKRCCKIFNTDQGAQFTAKTFVDVVLYHHIKVSMDGRGRALDNVFIERLWRSLKYECIYLVECVTIDELKRILQTYFNYYNYQRHHQGLAYKTPAQMYYVNRLKPSPNMIGSKAPAVKATPYGSCATLGLDSRHFRTARLLCRLSQKPTPQVSKNRG